MYGSSYMALWARLTTVVVPVALYFLLLGVLNSRKHPQLLTGRRDFALLIGALCPLVVLPVLSAVGVSVAAVGLCAVAVVGGVLVLAPPKGTWVLYNIPAEEARDAVDAALGRMGIRRQAREDGFRLPDCHAVVQISSFPLLRNVSVRLRGGDDELLGRFSRELGAGLARIEAPTSPMAVSLLLVATAMLVAPLGMMAHQAEQIVRLLTDLLQ